MAKAAGKAGLRGVLITLVGAALWGFSGACVQFLGAHYEIAPMFITAARMLGAGVLFLALLIATRRDELRDIFSDRMALVQLAAFGCLGLLLGQVTYVITINYTNSGTATVLQSLNIVIILVATCVMSRRSPRFLEALGVGIATIATALIATKGDFSALNIPVEGLVWGIISASAVAFYVMYPRKLFARWGSMPVTGLGMLIGGAFAAIVWLAMAFVEHASMGVQVMPDLDGTAVLMLAVIAVVGTFGAFGLYLHGISLVGATLGSQLGAIEPVSATVISAVWLSTQFTWADWAGLVLMVATIVIVSAQSK